jgi:hypothetical protein
MAFPQTTPPSPHVILRTFDSRESRGNRRIRRSDRGVRAFIGGVGALLFTPAAFGGGLGLSTFPPAPGADPSGLVLECVDAETGREVLVPDARVTRSGSAFEVRIPHQDYVSVQVHGVEPGRLRVELRPLRQSPNEASAEGLLEGWQPFQRDSVTAGAVFRSLSSGDLVWLDPSLFISPWKDEIDVLGPRQVPSNLVLPRQTVDLPLGSLELNKPRYRLPLKAGAGNRLVAVQGEARVSDLLPLFQGGGSGSGLEILDRLKFTRVGLTSEWFPSPGEAVRETIETALDLKAGHQVSTSAAPFAGDVLLAAMTDLAGDREILIPTDLKLGDSRRAVSLSTPAQNLGRGRLVAGIAISRPADPNAPEGDPRRRRGARISAVLADRAGKIVQLPVFPAVQDSVSDFVRRAPETVAVQGRAGGLSALLVEAEDRPISMVYLLPRAGTVSVSLKELGGGLERIQGLEVRRYEFDGSFEGGRIDGETSLRRLTRFTRSTARKLP